MLTSIEEIVNKVVCAFRDIAGIDAIVLGGSHATRTANETSDIDIGNYYDDTIFDLEAFKQKAGEIDDENRRDAITDPGEWGPWINGGGWLIINGTAVDILFRNTKKVIQVIEECKSGKDTDSGAIAAERITNANWIYCNQML